MRSAFVVLSKNTERICLNQEEFIGGIEKTTTILPLLTLKGNLLKRQKRKPHIKINAYLKAVVRLTGV